MEGYTRKQAMCDTFLQAVEQENFRNGAFRGRITEDTSFEDAINIFLESGAVTDDEKQNYFQPMRSLMAAMEERETRNSNHPQLLLDTCRMSDLCAVFTLDMQSKYSGGTEYYDGPMLVQKVEPGLEVTETYTVDNDGNRKDFADGQFGVTPDAPDWYKRMQADRMKPFFDKMKEDEAKFAVQDGDSSNLAYPSNTEKEDGHFTDPAVKSNKSLPVWFGYDR